MPSSPGATSGKVYIVGAGPGDPGLITVKGARLLAAADIVFYDDLLDTRLLELTRPDCENVYAGHRGGRQPEPRLQGSLQGRLLPRRAVRPLRRSS